MANHNLPRTRLHADVHKTNCNGLTFREWHRAAGFDCKMQNPVQRLRDAWERGEDPCEWRAEAETRERAARAMTKEEA